ncbi:3-alpha-hydroxysteroid dehydrogenase [Steroidobacter agaridevorans]|uniref:3-alpha-hydroxysteroid dehydrogenase n=1 Tax=Steroidobacter agaridevorans TaxID=2695856 RepID=A0A829Y9G6_9GAMM|nr:coniferyl-alcohol dehydrogenase [Steroidobacter agaridevorans]GFE79800.1 3-alpha-hydroxysteroid dehydrogenase [Steroidobacter agaridevorans]GFE90656.1 3-alpha-hydroxysteroid dehydrogenase [Steroidobacter agaridevorans]
MGEFASYRNKRVVISGCFSGMGEATARLLLQLGAEVHGLDYKPSKLNLASFTQVDLREPAAIDAAVKKIGGKVDALFNCAGLPQTSPPLDVMKVNYAGTRRLTEQVLPLMSAGGAIVSISSNGGLGWSRRLPVLMGLLKIDSYDGIVKWCQDNAETVREGYAFSKEALIVWTMMTSTHLIKRGIRINCTMPGPTQTPMMSQFEQATAASVLEAAAQPINRRSTPEEQAGPLVFLNSDAASYINGVALPVDGGFLGGVATGQIDLSAMMAGAAKSA